MRKVNYTTRHDKVKKVMIYECSDGVYVFGYDCLQDTFAISDNLQDTVEDAEDFCKDEYNIDSSNWIVIDDPVDGCQYDFILPTRVKNKNIDNPECGHFQTLVNGRWVDIVTLDKIQSFKAMTVNERLFVSGLIDVFDKSKISDKKKAKQILSSLQVDEPSIELLIK